MLPRRTLDHDPLALGPGQRAQRVGREVLQIGCLTALQHGCSVAAEAARRHRMMPGRITGTQPAGRAAAARSRSTPDPLTGLPAAPAADAPPRRAPAATGR